MPFKTLRLIQPLLSAVHSEGYTKPTAIQQEAIPHVLEGRDLMGSAQTGTGKTAAFALPILQRLHEHAAPSKPRGRKKPSGPSKPIRALILTPTRELAAQIGESFRMYGQNTKLRHTVIFGGVKQSKQTVALRRGVDILVATPGRLLDLLNQRLLSLGDVEILVLDEADRMLDMGFIHDIRRVTAQIPAQRQTLMFSATMPREIRTLADTLLKEPVRVKVAAESPAADTVEQALYFVDSHSKPALLEHLLEDPEITKALIFTRTKHGADKVVRRLGRVEIAAEAIHSNKSQNARQRALANFKRGKTRVLVASDIAARGLDVDDISHVINFDMPNVAETYVHRIGRTGRAGASGQAISFCCNDQRAYLRDIERLLGNAIAVLPHSFKTAAPVTKTGRGSSGSGRKPGATKNGSSAHSSRRTKTPEQQKEEFWRSRRRRGSKATGGARSGAKRRGK
jgi:ATP-dependent RNA helicase RhlE